MTVGRDPSGLENIVVRPVYLRAVNAIVQPEQQIPCSVYFFRKWLPRLGALRWCLVLTLRSVCTQRQPDGTNRGEICRAEIAELLGVHEATISRLLPTAPSTIHRGWRTLQAAGEEDVETANLAKFIPRLRYKYERDAAAGVTRRVGYIIDVVMDDPLIPDDEEHLAVVLAEQVLQSLPYASSVKGEPTLPQPGDAQSLPGTTGQQGHPRQQRRREIQTGHLVKEQDASLHSSVKTQNARNTRRVTAHDTLAHSTVNQQKVTYDDMLAQNEPVLTLTNNYIYRDINVKLNMSRKHDVRAAVAPLVRYAADSLNDDHSTGMFYSTVTQLYPYQLDVFTSALEFALEEGERSESVNMGAVFVRTIRELAAARGIPLRLGKATGAGRSPEVEELDQIDEAENEDPGPLPVINKQPKPVEKNRGRTYVKDSGVSMKQLWPAVLAELTGRTTRANYEMWLRHCNIVRADKDVVVVGAPSAFARDWVNDRLLVVIKRALGDLLGREVEVVCEVQESR